MLSQFQSIKSIKRNLRFNTLSRSSSNFDLRHVKGLVTSHNKTFHKIALKMPTKQYES